MLNNISRFTNFKPDNPFKPICYKCIAGDNIEFPPKVSYIDASKYEEKELTTYQDNLYPIIIKMVMFFLSFLTIFRKKLMRIKQNMSCIYMEFLV